MMRFWKVNEQQNLFLLIIAVLIPVLIGAYAGYLTSESVEIYRNLNRPSFSPPSWVFGPVWTTLYILMGIASYRIYLFYQQNRAKITPLIYYGIQLALNFFWTLIFFRYQERGWAFFELILLWIFILITLILFYKKDNLSGYLLIPYILWVSFAGILNYSVWVMN